MADVKVTDPTHDEAMKFYDAAHEALRPWRDNCSEDENFLVAMAIARAVAAGVAAERERCAKVVENRAGADAYADDNRPCGPCCTLNAAAIRAGEVRG